MTPEQEDYVRRVRAAMDELHELQDKYGEDGVIAFMLGVPVEEIWKVSGKTG